LVWLDIALALAYCDVIVGMVERMESLKYGAYLELDIHQFGKNYYEIGN
jgi:hypothetical protein